MGQGMGSHGQRRCSARRATRDVGQITSLLMYNTGFGVSLDCRLGRAGSVGVGEQSSS